MNGAVIDRPVSFTKRGLLRDGSHADYLGQCPITGRHRVRTRAGASPKIDGTVWLLDEHGRACRGRESAQDWIGPA